MTAILREPLLHFLVLGAAVFALFAALDDTPPPVAADRLEVTEADAARLARQFEATWRRPPSEDELAGLIDGHVREEVLVREAIVLGLDRDDAVVRQRLAQKMTFLTESGAEAVEATDAALAAHLAAHPERFARAGLVAFEQVMLREGADPEPLRVALRAGEAVVAFAAPSLLPERVTPSPPAVVDGTFGQGFHAAVSALAPGGWAGPVESVYGRHLVRVLSVEPPGLPPLAEIREAVERDWRATMRARLAEERYAALAARYDIVRPDPAAVLLE
ncbi:MAG: peptidylprolyl isomerase [Paracoccaceae bacterium]|jgi:hypothetical protein|nr:peptidylprolyl isomerase [Paracoccaceae bacterium]